MFHFLSEIHYQEFQHFIYSVDEGEVKTLGDFNDAPMPMPSHLYIHIQQCGQNISYLHLTDNMRNEIDIPDDDRFWVIENTESINGTIFRRILLETEIVSKVDRNQPYNLHTTFKLISGNNYRVVYNCKTILQIRAHQSWKIVS